MFHMATFFMISGYLYNDKNSDSFRNVFEYVKRKIKSLYLPYITLNGVAVIMNNALIKIGFYTEDPRFLTIGGANAIISSVFSATDILKEIFKTLLFFGGSQVGGATWFLRALFIASVAHCLVVFGMKKLGINKFKWIFILLELCLGGVSLQLLMNVLLPYKELILQTIASYLAFLFGVIMRRIEEHFCVVVEYPTLSCIASAALIYLMMFCGNISVSAGNVTNVILYTCASLIGWIFTESLAQMLERFERISNVLSYCGKRSLYIVLWHFLCMKIVTFAYIVMSGKDMVLLASHPVLNDSTSWLWIIYSIVGICVPLMIEYIYTKGRKFIGMKLN